ncbi:MAG: Gfo/Idh/MocA family oxidoreductase [Gemmataceae bacterium]|nr:Gfo/Idh/MocA family oxidoreductase [Gemmataceae bacterium]
MTAKTLKGALIGAGFFAGFQAEGWQRVSGVEITALAEPLAERAREFAARWGIPRIYASAAELLRHERPDFVDIATRPELHLPLVELAAAHGVQVICQKPMAPAWEECLRMVEVCRAAQVRRLLIHENWRWQAWYREVKRLLDANRIAGEAPPPVAFGVFTLEGEHGSLRMTPQGDLFTTEYGKPEVKHAYEQPQQGYKGDSVFAAQQHYATCLRDGVSCETEGADYLKSVRAMFACYESAETGRLVQL